MILALPALLAPAASAEPDSARKEPVTFLGLTLSLPDLPVEEQTENAAWPRLLTADEIDAAARLPAPAGEVLGPLLIGRSEELRERAVDVESTPQRTIIDARIKQLRQKARALAAVPPIDQGGTSQ